MAVTDYGVNHAMAVKIWANNLAVEALKATSIYDFIGEGADNVIQRRTQTEKSAGDQITYGLRMQLTGRGVQGRNTLEGNEEALSVFTDAVLINKLRHAVRSGSSSSISQQRVPFNIRQEALDGLVDWAADRLDTWFFNQLCGYTAESDTIYTGNQAVVAPDADHVIRQTARANDETLVAGDEFTLDLIDKAVERAKTLSPPIRPLNMRGRKYFVLFLHPYQVTDLRLDATTAGQWFDIQQAAMQGGDVTENPIFTGALGCYNGTILVDNTRVTQGVHSGTGDPETDVRRAVFCGAQAACMAFGQGSGPRQWNWVEELFDYEEELGVAAGTIAGLKKTRFNSADYGTITLPSFAIQKT